MNDVARLIRSQCLVFFVVLNLCTIFVADAQANEQWSSAVVNLMSDNLDDSDPNSGDLNRENLSLRVWIDPAHEPVVSQQINLHIELATTTWFTGGTQIGVLDIDHVVVLRREKFAVNSTRIQNQKTWTVQLWTLTLYPQRAGQYIIPEIAIEVSVADESSKATTQSLSTEPINFNALMPDEILRQPELTGERSWVASNNLEVIEDFDKTLTELKVGDALKRTIELKSENVAAMMLPVLQFNATPGLAVYQRPAKIEDKVNRGSYLASRTEEITYVVEKAGAYKLPRQEIFWWDLSSQTLQREILAERTISTSGSSNSASIELPGSGASAESNFWTKLTKILAVLMVVLLIIASFLWLRNRLAKRDWQPRKDRRLMHLRQKYREHCRAANYVRASDLLFQWLDGHLDAVDQIKLKASDHSIRRWLDSLNSLDAKDTLASFDQLMRLAHAQTNAADTNSGENENLEALPSKLKKILDALARVTNDDANAFRLN